MPPPHYEVVFTPMLLVHWSALQQAASGGPLSRVRLRLFTPSQLTKPVKNNSFEASRDQLKMEALDQAIWWLGAAHAIGLLIGGYIFLHAMHLLFEDDHIDGNNTSEGNSRGPHRPAK